jgi:hypothetical protein
MVREIQGYREQHHIVPKSLGGSNKSDNLVSLTAKEHFICHLLLTRMVEGVAKKKMTYALWLMCNVKNPVQQRHVPTGSTYEKVRIQHSINISQKFKGVKKTYYHWLNKTHSQETKQKQSLLKQGKNNPMYGREQSAETIKKIKESQIGIQKPKFTCECCGALVGGKSNYSRWHGINCKTRSLV